MCSRNSLSAEYQDKLDVLREPIPERALYVPGDEGADKAHCFTNYEPHFNTAMRLDNVIMGFPPEGWTYVKSQTWTETEKVYGYMDTKPYFEVRRARVVGAYPDVYFLRCSPGNAPHGVVRVGVHMHAVA
jgi:hypothetical protein